MSIYMALYIVGTPIGNLKDITQRALEILKSAEFIIAESPSDSLRLLRHFEINPKKIIKYNDKNRQRAAAEIINILKTKNAAYLTSAGMPGISDPGADLAKECHKNSIKIILIPGPSALTSAIAISGIRAHSFGFESFIPKKQGQIEKLFQKYAEDKQVLVFFESPFRLLKTLGIIAKNFPITPVFVAKELTKIFENYFFGTASEIINKLKSDSKNIKGEFTVIINFTNR